MEWLPVFSGGPPLPSGDRPPHFFLPQKWKVYGAPGPSAKEGRIWDLVVYQGLVESYLQNQQPAASLPMHPKKAADA